VNASVSTAARWVAALPYVAVVLLPLIPMLVQLADVVPRGISIGGRGPTIFLAIVVGAVLAGAVIGMVVAWGPQAFTKPPLALPLAVLIGSQIVAASLGVFWQAGAFEIGSQIGDAIAFFAFWWTVRDERTRRGVIACYLASGILASVFAIALTLSRHPPAEFAYEHGRAAGTFLQPNEFAGYLLFLIPIGLAQAAASPALRRLGYLAAAIGVCGLALSVSRAAWVGMLLALPILLVRFGRRVVIAYAAVVVVVVSVGFVGLSNVAHDPSENASRIAVWRGAARMAERFALTGVGPLNFSRVYPSLKLPDAAVDEVHAHDVPLNVLVENGILGLAAFIWIVIASVKEVRAAGARIPPADHERRLLFAGLCAAFAASAVQNTVDLVSTFVLLLWWPMLALMLALGPPAPSESEVSEAMRAAA
jgi:O-antigen ligase